VFAVAVVFELFIPDCHTLKQKRTAVRPIVDGLHRRFRVSAAEVGHLDKWQRADIGIAVVSGTESHVRDVLGEIERFVWSFPEIEVLTQRRTWLDVDDAV
jgi:uncharacterized protein YlxP (DUF503 family)